MTDLEKTGQSLWKIHLNILGVRDDGLPRQLMEEERERADRVSLLPLDLPVKSHKPWYTKHYAWSLAVLAATILLMLVSPQWLVKDEADRIKGMAKVSFYRERGGDVSLVKVNDSLRPHDRVRVAVNAAFSGTVAIFHFVPHATAPLTLMSRYAVQESEVGRRLLLPGSFEVTSSSEGEVIVVSVCPDDVSEDDLSQSLLKALLHDDRNVLGGSYVDSCFVNGRALGTE